MSAIDPDDDDLTVLRGLADELEAPARHIAELARTDGDARLEALARCECRRAAALCRAILAMHRDAATRRHSEASER